MKKSILLIFGLLFTLNSFASDPLDEFQDKFSLGMAYKIDPENLLSFFLPKVSMTYYMPHQNYETYCGIDASMWAIMAFNYSFGAYYGIRKELVTFDTSIAYWRFPYQNSFDGWEGPYSNITLNPKIGLKYKWFWFKAGPSFPLNREFPDNSNSWNSFDLSEFRSYNFEIALHIPFVIPNMKKINEFNNRQK